jgi:acyl transferase domain-containing protein
MGALGLKRSSKCESDQEHYLKRILYQGSGKLRCLILWYLPKEAEQMNPYQKIGLEVTWEALEGAGLNPKSLSGSDTAVYIGVDSDDYSRLLFEDLPNIEAWMGIGTTAHGIPNRISYHLDLMVPSATVDAACASSLVAVNSGRQAILARESCVAIVGGVNVCLPPVLFHMPGAAGALSPDGVCLHSTTILTATQEGKGLPFSFLEGYHMSS